MHGELGTSFHRREPVLSIVLSGPAEHDHPDLLRLFIAYAFGILAGAYLAWNRGTWIEGVVMPIALATRAAPEFWLGMILLAVFAFWLGWFPSGGANSAGAMYAGELERGSSRATSSCTSRCRRSRSRSTCRVCRFSSCARP